MSIQLSVEPLRPSLRERTLYKPNLPEEQFIVPLLRREIEGLIGRFATPPIGSSRAIDVGCGGQPFRALLEGLGYAYCGVDVNADGGKPLDFVCAIDAPLPEGLLRSEPFDFCLCTEVLEHVADWEAAFANLRTLLTPGGRILITVPHVYQLHEEPYDFWRPTLHGINFFARRAGFRQLYQHNAGDGWDVLGTVAATLRFQAASRALRDRVTAKVIRIANRMVFRTILRANIRQRVKAESLIYLSNVVVLEKAA